MIGINPKNSAGGQDRADANGRKPMVAGSSIGAILRERREALGASLAEVEAATKIRQKYLSALEADEWQMLPGEVVGRGFLRNYAAYLGIEPTEIIERRRAIADPSLSSALAATSAGSELPPMRAVDYRPKDVDLREEPESLEERTPPRLGPLLAVLGVILILLVAWWGVSRYGDSILDGVTSTASRATAAIGGLFARAPEATPTLSLAIVAERSGAVDAGATPTSTSVFVPAPAVEAPPAQEVAVPAPAEPGGLLLPTATPQGAVAGAAAPAPVQPPPQPAVEAPTATPVPPTPVPQVAPVTVNALANLRAAPNVESIIAGSADVGQALSIVGRTADGLWYLLDNGAWIYGELVTGAPVDVPVAEPTPGPEPEVAATAAVEAPIAEAVAAIVAAACADPRAQITSPGQNQVVSGLVNIEGTATHEAFASYKIEAGPPGGGMAFIGSSNAPVVGGVLGTLDTATFGNGPLLIRVTVVDQTSNFPPPCEVTVSAQN